MPSRQQKAAQLIGILGVKGKEMWKKYLQQYRAQALINWNEI